MKKRKIKRFQKIKEKAEEIKKEFKLKSIDSALLMLILEELDSIEYNTRG